MNKFILRWIINAIAIFLAVKFVPGIRLESGLTSIIWLALILGLINAFVRPVLKFLTCPLIVLTLGLFTLFINTFVFWLTAQVGQFVGIDITIEGFWAAFWGALLVSVVSVILSLILRDEFTGRRRHGHRS